MRISAVVLAGALATSTPVQSKEGGALLDARETAASVLAGDADAVLARSDPTFVSEFGGEAKLRAFIAGLPAQYGKEIKLDHDRLRLRAVGPILARIVETEKGGPVRIDIGFDGVTGLVRSLSVTGARGKGKPVPPRAGTTHLTLPFGMPRPGHVWAISNGGADVIDNYHARLDTYYAMDVSPRPLNALTDTANHTATPCWGLPIRAAAPGKVAIVRDGMPDGPSPGPSNPGNHVIIDHENGEFTLYAHLQQGSVSVAAGQRVSRREEIGRCGRSGNTEVPHLHFQLMDGSDLDTARGIPLVFHDYYAPLRYVERGTPVGGDVVFPAIPLGRAK